MCVLLSVFPPQSMERVVWLVISVCGASLLLDVLSAQHTEMNDLVSFNRAALSDQCIFQTKPASCGGNLSINEGPLQAHASRRVQSEAAFPPQRKQTDAVMWAL